MDRQAILQEKELIVTQIKKYIEQVRPFFDLDVTLAEYSKSLYDIRIPQEHRERQKLLKRCIVGKLESLFSAESLQSFRLNLDHDLVISIVDHHQILNHPLLIGDNVVGNAQKFLQPKKQDAILVISSGDVPPNNYFSKNGFQFHGRRIPLFSNSEKEFSTYYIQKRDFHFIERLKSVDRWKEFTEGEKTFLQSFEQTLTSYDFSRCADYKDQITVIVKNVWPLMFAESLRATLPELLYVTQEEIVTECLIALLQDDNLVSASLFDKKLRSRILEEFRGIVVAWDETHEKGTHFFWRKYPGEPRALRLYVKDDMLMPTDTRYKDRAFKLERDTIIDLLQQREIYPSLFMIFLVLNYYSGMQPLAGYGSVKYLDLMKQAWLRILVGTRFDNEIPLIQSVQTNAFIAGFPIFFGRTNGAVQTLYTADIVERGGMSEAYLRHIFGMKFRDLLSVAVADMYDYYAQKYIPETERIKPKIGFDDLANIAFEWV